MTINYPYLTYVATYAQALDYDGVQNLGRPFMYSGGPVVDETSYNAITWLEPSFPKPPWGDIAYYQSVLQIMGTTPQFGIDGLYGDSVLDGRISAKLDIPTGTTAQYIRGDGSLGTFPTVQARSFADPSRTIGTAFKISSTRDASVLYSIPVTSNATVLAGSQISATFRYADDSGITTNVVTLPGDQFGIASGVLVSGIGSLKLVGIVPANKWVMITTTNVSGTPTVGTMTSQEVLL